MTVARDFFSSKTTLAALGASFLLGLTCVTQHRMPNELEIGGVWALWMIAFHRDSSAKNTEIQAGLRDPNTKKPLIS